MGLSVCTGDYASAMRDGDDVSWYDEQLQIVNEVLALHGQPEHIEPKELPKFEYRSCIGFPYSFLHYLRRIYVRRTLGQTVVPVSGDEITQEDEADIEEVSLRGKSHLLYHSDCEGFYIPIDFSHPIADDRMLGGAIGSTQGLLRELLAIAPVIGITTNGHFATEDALTELESYDESNPFYIERVVWHSLYENCMISLHHNSAITFC